MSNDKSNNINNDTDPQETQEWKDSIKAVFNAYGKDGESGKH